jgi:hypothetical protein
MNTDKHRFYILERLKNKRPNGTRMNTDTHGSLLKGKRNGKTVRSLSKSPVPKVSFFGQAIPEIPPCPPFLKGGWGGFQRIVAQYKFAYQNVKSLQFSGIDKEREMDDET